MSNIDATIIPIIEQKFKEMESNFKELFPEEKISALIKNLVEGAVKRHLVESANKIVWEKIGKIVDENIGFLFQEKNINFMVQHTIKKAMYSDIFQNHFMTHMNEWLSCHFPTD